MKFWRELRAYARVIYLVFIINVFTVMGKEEQGVDGVLNDEFATALQTSSNSALVFDIEEPLVVVLMVKNEEHAIIPTLKPCIDGGITKFFIYDTGSTDNTMAVAREYFNQRRVRQAYIVQEEFIDFATSRNRGLELAKEKFPTTPFMLMPDADWYINNVPELLDFCRERANVPYPDNYSVRIMNEHNDFQAPGRLLKTYRNSKFVGEVHEVPVPAYNESAPNTVFFEWRPSSKGWEATQKRWLRDREVLKKALEKRPDDTRTIFYLAQTEDGLGNLEEAYRLYKLRSTLPGWPEEDYITVYRLGDVTNRLVKQGVSGYTWDEAQSYFLKAYNMRSHRAEPLVRLAEHYWENQEFALTFMFARRAVELPYPEHDFLSIEKRVYELDRFDLVSKSAWHVGECLLGERATRRALKHNDRAPYLYRNLAFYLDPECANKRPTDLWGYDWQEPEQRDILANR